MSLVDVHVDNFFRRNHVSLHEEKEALLCALFVFDYTIALGEHDLLSSLQSRVQSLALLKARVDAAAGAKQPLLSLEEHKNGMVKLRDEILDLFLQRFPTLVLHQTSHCPESPTSRPHAMQHIAEAILYHSLEQPCNDVHNIRAKQRSISLIHPMLAIARTEIFRQKKKTET